MIRYATKQVTIDGRTFNIGDIVPAAYLRGAAGIENWSRGEGEEMPPIVPEATAVRAASFSATEEVNKEEPEDEASEETEEESADAEETEETTDEVKEVTEIAPSPTRRRSR